MLDITPAVLNVFKDPYADKFFVVELKIPNNLRRYSTKPVSVYDTVSGGNIFFDGVITDDDISFKAGFRFKDNSSKITTITIKANDPLDLFEISKSVELNLVETALYFGADGLNFQEFLPLIEGIADIKYIGSAEEEFSFDIVSLDFKYDNLFPPTKLDPTLSYTLLENDAEKYIGESVPIAFGRIERPGFPIPLYYDDGVNIRRYATVDNHAFSLIEILADGEVIPSDKYTITSRDNTWAVQPRTLSTSDFTITANGNGVDPAFYSVAPFGDNDFQITINLPPRSVFWEVLVNDEVAAFTQHAEYYRLTDTWRLYVHVDDRDNDTIVVFGDGVQVDPLQITFDPVFPSGWIAEIRVRTPNTGNDFFQVYAEGFLVDAEFYEIQHIVETNTYIITVNDYNYYNIYFAGKKVTAAGRALLGDNVRIAEMIKYILENYSNLPPELVDSDFIDAQNGFLTAFRVARFFNGDSTAFDTINDLATEFPYITTDRGLKKAIHAVNSNIDFSYGLTLDGNIFDRDREIMISDPDELYNIFSVRYKYDALNNRWHGYKFRNRNNDSNCLDCFNRIAMDKEMPTLELYSVKDDGVAESVLDYLTYAFTRFYYLITYICDISTLILEVGDGVLVTDHELNITDKKFIILNKNLDSSHVTLVVKNMEPL